jgi:hypothetical protein
MLLKKYFCRKILRKKLAFFARNKAKLCKNWIISLIFEKNANFFAENCRKSPKIVIITSTHGHPGHRLPVVVLGFQGQQSLRKWWPTENIIIDFYGKRAKPFIGGLIEKKDFCGKRARPFIRGIIENH